MRWGEELIFFLLWKLFPSTFLSSEFSTTNLIVSNDDANCWEWKFIDTFGKSIFFSSWISTMTGGRRDFDWSCMSGNYYYWKRKIVFHFDSESENCWRCHLRELVVTCVGAESFRWEKWKDVDCGVEVRGVHEVFVDREIYNFMLNQRLAVKPSLILLNWHILNLLFLIKKSLPISEDFH